MKTLVTGAAGFIGSTLTKRLLADGHQVTAIDSFTDYYARDKKLANVAPILDHKGLTLLSRDLNEMDLEATLRGVNWIFHLAGQPGVRGSWGETFSPYLTNNVMATQRLLEAAKSQDSLERFVYSSSSSVYGDAAEYPCLETGPTNPHSPYGVTKLAAEHLVSLYARNFDVPTTSLRYFTVYGPRQRPDMAFTRFTTAAHLGTEITIFGDGEQVRDFTFVEDVATANILAASVKTPLGAVYNVAGGSNASVNDALSLIEKLSGKPLSVRYEAKVAGDVLRTGGDTRAFCAATGWVPSVTLEQGLSLHLSWAEREAAS